MFGRFRPDLFFRCDFSHERHDESTWECSMDGSRAVVSGSIRCEIPAHVLDGHVCVRMCLSRGAKIRANLVRWLIASSSTRANRPSRLSRSRKLCCGSSTASGRSDPRMDPKK
ncbi:unnamed protein product [Mycena citricolor]|uniref:Uncharacterized protein n=1 Tax=Mycena citricolor TaxID=2018698 RepID=A0AAD2K0R7_9AGAR|nr:unnamed protein product [Mycena citricolor]